MGTVLAPVRRRILAGAFVAGLALALLAPTAAFAANTATFSSRVPAPGSWTTATRPTIAVTVYDRYGMRGAGAWSVTVDGVSVPVKATYLVRGSWNPSRPDYHRVRLSGRAPVALAPGKHKVTVKIRDIKQKSSTTSWTFTVKAPVTFSSPAPANGSSSQAARPVVSVSAYALYGAKGSGKFTMMIDGAPVTPAVTYTTNYTKFKISRPALTTDLSVGAHTVVVGVTDVKGNTRSYTWTFTTLDPPLLPMPGSAAVMEDCASCHPGYPAAHPMANCQGCHSKTAPPRQDGSAMSPYTPADPSAHLAACAANPRCHRSSGTFPHVLGSDCAHCHTGSYPGVPSQHPSSLESAHLSTSAFCAGIGCHSSSLTVEHYRRTVGGVVGAPRLSCASCHESTDPVVVAAIDTRSTACGSCHSFAGGGHPNTSTAHLLPSISCTAASGCHTGDVTSVHKGNCGACHAADRTTSKSCPTCHTAGDYHADQATAHVLPAGGCIGTGCHGDSSGADAGALHLDRCDRCHGGTGTPVKTCNTCHGSDTLAVHPGQALAHTAAAVSCTTTDCHGRNVTTTHANASVGPCAACHDGLHTATKVCSGCHEGDVATIHVGAAAKHVVGANNCIASNCHSGTDVATIHDTATGGPGCVCHESGETETVTCATLGCHFGELETVHGKVGTRHTSTNATCVSSTCHKTDVGAIHKTAPLGCVSCHNGGTLTIACATCHAGDTVSIHSSADTSHTVPAGMCVTACHSNNVSGIHSGSTLGCTACHDGVKTLSTRCADCHTGTTQEQHAFAGGYHSSPNNGCVLPGCHISDVTELHLALSDSGCSRCHASGQTPTIECTLCHGSDVPTVHETAEASHTVAPEGDCGGAPCHSTNVAVIHNVQDVGCGVCHGEGKPPLTTVCGTCHPGGVMVVHQRSDVSHTVAQGGSCYTPTCHNTGNVAAIHQLNALSCSACHTPRATTIICNECHPRANVPALHASADTSHTAPTGTCVKVGCHSSSVAVLHLNGPNCAICHGLNAPTTLNCATSGCHSTNLNTVHAGGAPDHVAHAGYCVRSGCHGGDLTSIHDAGGTGIGCGACHNNPDHDTSDTCTDCHPATETENHASADTSHTVTQSTCAGYTGSTPCHRTHVDSIHRTAPDGCRSCHSSGTTLSVVCSTCHVGPNAPTHASAETTHAVPAGLCINGQCHDNDVAVIHVNSTQNGEPLSCLGCHGPDATPSVVCSNCHPSDPLTFHDQATLTTAHAVPGGATCIAVGCHSGTNVTAIHSGSARGCLACHDSDRVASSNCQAAAPCHGSVFETTHAPGDSFHALVQDHTDIRYRNCVGQGCHTGNADQIHAAGTDPPGCAACHSNPNHGPSITCADCHVGTTQQVHDPYIGTKHDSPTTGPSGACNSAGCHYSSVSRIHSELAHGYTPQNPPPGCTPCHETGPLTVDCLTCHETEVVAVHASADTSHTVPSGGSCVKAAPCHQSNVSLLHVKNSVAHCEACHTGGLPTYNCATCHFGGFTTAHPAPADLHGPAQGWCVKSGCHDTNVATIHTTQLPGGPTPPDCDACHAAGKTPSLVCSGSGCHPLAVPNSHTAPAPAHTSTDGCVGLCHNANVATIHATGTTPPGCYACHQYGKAHSLTCADCHSVGTYHAGAAGYHAVSNACTGCHGTDVSVIHVKNSVQHCEACHVSPNPTTDCAVCHGSGSDHTASHGSCNGCHGSLEHGAGPTIGVSGCTSCHGQGGTWNHPWEDCHCQDPTGMSWSGIW
jgi:hypothetical protein